QELSLFSLAAGIPDQTGAATGDGDRGVAKPLQTRQSNNRQERANMQARRGRIEANVGGELFLFEHFAQLGRRFSAHAAPLDFNGPCDLQSVSCRDVGGSTDGCRGLVQLVVEKNNSE